MASHELRPKRSRTLTDIPTDVLPFHSGPRQGPSPFHIDVHDVITVISILVHMQDQSTSDGWCVGNPLKIISSHLPVIKARSSQHGQVLTLNSGKKMFLVKVP